MTPLDRIASIRLLLVGSSLVLAVTAASAAPQQLLGKSVQVSWTESIHTRAPDGRTFTDIISRQRIAYISSAGRIFVKALNQAKGGQKNREVAPGAGPGALKFEGNRMVGYAAFAGFARQLSVSFDPSFASCTANVVYGSSGGARTWRNLRDDQTLEVLSISPVSASCSIRDGNAAAS